MIINREHGVAMARGNAGAKVSDGSVRLHTDYVGLHHIADGGAIQLGDFHHLMEALVARDRGLA